MTLVNVTLGSGKAVHVAEKFEDFMPSPECGGNRATERYRTTTREVTCKRCLKWLAARAEETARNAYYASVAETQDAVMAQAEPVATEAPATEAIIVSEDGNRATLTYGEHSTEMVVVGDSWHFVRPDGGLTNTRMMTKRIAARVWVEWLAAQTSAKDAARDWADVVADAPPQTLKNTGTDDLKAQIKLLKLRLATLKGELASREPAAQPDVETDPVTGWPVFRVGPGRYAVSPRIQGPFGGVGSVKYFWLDGPYGRKNGRTAYPDHATGTVQRQLWQARYDFDMARQASH